MAMLGLTKRILKEKLSHEGAELLISIQALFVVIKTQMMQNKVIFVEVISIINYLVDSTMTSSYVLSCAILFSQQKQDFFSVDPSVPKKSQHKHLPRIDFSIFVSSLTCDMYHNTLWRSNTQILPISKKSYFHNNTHKNVSEENWDSFRNRSANSHCIST